MKILFWGDTKQNAGPMNINKGIAQNLTEQFFFVRETERIKRILKGLKYLLASDVLVLSGGSRMGCILMAAAKLMGKPSVYIMHGCAVYENRLNNRHDNVEAEKIESFILKNAALLLPVSKKFMYWVHHRYPQYINKTEYLFNGIDWSSCKKTTDSQKKNGSVVVVGGLRKEKNNIPVIEAVEKLNGKADLLVVGLPEHEIVAEKRYTSCIPKVPQQEFYGLLSQTQLFVLNSTYETFGISVSEALACGCSVLVSEIVGITDLFALEETDLIHNPLNIDEIREKIDYLLDYPNNQRILSSFHEDEWSFAKMVHRLELRCLKLAQNWN